MPEKTFKNLLLLAEKLRSDMGCPWDREQTIVSMLEHLEEEAHEVREAIENGDHENLKEELGDLMFQIVMISEIAKEKKYFTMEDVICDIDKKIRKRHTWVFGKDKVRTPEEAVEMWRRNKKIEKARKNVKK